VEVNVMRVVIVYESLFGNTHEIAEAVGDGVAQAQPDAEVTRVPVADAGTDLVEAADLLIVGGPTHMRGMTSAFSRKMGLQAEEKKAQGDAVHEQHEPGAEGPGLRDWFHNLPKASPGRRAAAFDTRADARMAGGAAQGIARRLRNHRYELVAEPEGFIIEDVAGPLREGELERAAAWGIGLVRQPVR
jgi:Flavodoxin